MFLRNKAAVVGLAVFSLIVLVTIFGPGLYGTSANKMVARPFLGPGSELAPLLGTDYLGRDILAGIIGGGRATLLVAAVAAAMTMTIGIVVGSLAGYFGGWVDALLMRFTEIFQVMPGLLFSMVVIFLLGPWNSKRGPGNRPDSVAAVCPPCPCRVPQVERNGVCEGRPGLSGAATYGSCSALFCPMPCLPCWCQPP